MSGVCALKGCFRWEKMWLVAQCVGGCIHLICERNAEQEIQGNLS